MKKQWFYFCLLAVMLTLGAAGYARADELLPSLTVNGSPVSASVDFNGTPNICICAPGATAVRILADRLYQDDNPKSWSRYFDRYEAAPVMEENGMRMFDQGTWLITAAYTLDDYEDGTDLEEAPLNWISIGEGVTVQVRPYLSRLSPPDAYLSADAVPRGGLVTVTVSSFQHKGEWYWMDLEKKTLENGWEMLDHIDTPIQEDLCSSFSLDTSALDPGDYRLWFRCEAVSYEDAGVYLPFTVEAAPLPEMPVLRLSQSQALTSQDIRLYAYAPGAEYVSCDITWERYDNWYESRSGDGEHNIWTFSSSDSGTFTLTLKAWQGEVVYAAESVTLTLDAPYGELDDPVIQDVPGVLSAGEGINGSFIPDERANEYHIELYYCPEEGERESIAFLFRRKNEAFSTSLSFPGGLFARPGMYSLLVHEHRTGWEGGHAERRFLVVAGDADEGFEVSKQNALTREGISYQAYARGAGAIRVVCGADLCGEEDGEAISGFIDFDEPGDYELKAIVPDGDGWRVVGEPALIHVTAPYGALDAEITSPAFVSPEGIADVTVTWHTQGKACRYEVRLNSQDWEELPLETVSFAESGGGTAVGVYRIRGEDLPADAPAIIEAVLRPDEPGYLVTRIRGEIAAMAGTVAGEVSVSQSTVLRCEEAYVTVDVPGATALYVYRGEGRWEGFAGSHAEASWPFFQVGENLVYARYTTEAIADPENVDYSSLTWTGCTPAASVRVITLGKLARPDYTLENEIVKRGEPFRFTINTLQGHDEWYTAALRDMDGRDVVGNCFWDAYSRTVTVETAAAVSDLYYLDLWNDAIGYESGGIRLFVAVEEAEEGLCVSLPQAPILTQKMYSVSAYAEGAERITMTLEDREQGEAPPFTIMRQGEVFSAYMSFESFACRRHVTVTAYYADEHTDVYEEDITVTAPYGLLPNPTLCMEAPWTEGEDLHFSVDAAMAPFIVVEIEDRRTENMIYSDEWANYGSWTYTIPADAFTPGHPVNITVYSAAEGYNNNKTLFWMAMLPEAPTVLRLPSALTQVEEEGFAGCAFQKIIIPETVTAIADRAFADCPNILAVEIEDGAAGISVNAFEGAGPFMIYGEEGSAAESYAVQNPWATFIRLE